MTDGTGDLICLTRTTQNRLKSQWPATVRETYTIRTDFKTIAHGNDLEKKSRCKKRGIRGRKVEARGNGYQSPNGALKKKIIGIQKRELTYNLFNLLLQL